MCCQYKKDDLRKLRLAKLRGHPQFGDHDIHRWCCEGKCICKSDKESSDVSNNPTPQNKFEKTKKEWRAAKALAEAIGMQISDSEKERKELVEPLKRRITALAVLKNETEKTHPRNGESEKWQ